MVKRGGVQMKCWDLGGQSQYRGEWGRYTRGCNCILFVVDTAAMDLLPSVKQELHRLLDDRYILKSNHSPSNPWFRELATTPILVVANKIDLEPHATEQFLIKGSQLLNI